MQHTIIVPTHTIICPHLDVVVITVVQNILKSVYNRIQAKKSIQRHPIFLTNSDYDYILYYIERQDKLDF